MVSGSIGDSKTPGTEAVPSWLRRHWESMETTLFSEIVADPDLYERAVTAVRLTADELRGRCPDPECLVAVWDEAETVAGSAASRARLATAGTNLDRVASAAFALRFRELAAEATRQARLARLHRAREAGATWAILEESGSPDQAPIQVYQRIEVHVPTGTLLVATIEPDETCSRSRFRLEGGRLELTTGDLLTGDLPDIPPDEYGDRAAWESASEEIHRRLAKR